MSAYYELLSMLSSALSQPLNDLAAQINMPPATALLLGLIGAVAPCQLTTNISALAFISRRVDSRALVWRSALAYVAGKVLVYTLLGAGAILLGTQLSTALIPVMATVRKLFGPALILSGLFMLGLLRLNFALGTRLSTRLKEHAERTDWAGGFVLGSAFAFAFCPTLFLLFFGLLIPVSVSARGGLILPAVFAVGTTVPLLALSLAVSFAAPTPGAHVVKAKQVGRVLRPVAAVALVLLGIGDTLLYWFT